MKLRNKRTGEIADLAKRGLLKSDNDNRIIVYPEGPLKFYAYYSLAELNEEWEDYTPAEPLIKDEKVRKAVRAWAEVIGNKDDLVVSKNREYHDCCIYDGRLKTGALIDLGIDLDIDENSYTLAELCGEEEE